jgi:glycosyltransferase involved in cell wall biosynthesis
MRKPQVILINHYASIPRWPGPTRNFDFAANLVKQGWEINLFSCRFNHYLRGYLPKPPRIEAGVRLKWVWSTTYQGNSILRELNILVFSLLSFWRGLFTPAQVIVTVTPPLESAFSGWLLARVKRVPFVLDVEDLWPDSIIAMGFQNKLVLSWLRFLESFLYRHADYFLAVATEMQEYLIKRGVPNSKITMIPLGANLPAESSASQRNEIRTRYGWAEDLTVAVYVGAHGPANALETLIKAAQAIPPHTPIKIVLFGDGSDKPRLCKILNDLKLTNISLEESVSPELVPEILGAADIGIASLKDTETFKTVRPNKLYEYMAVGLPVICCIAGEASRLIEEVGSGIQVKPEDYRGLAVGLQKLAQDPAYCKELGRKGYIYVRQSGDRVKLAAQMGEVLKQVIKTHEK